MTIQNSIQSTKDNVKTLENDFKAKGRFRLLFSFGERVLEAAFYTQSYSLVSSSTIADVQTALLTAEEDRTPEQQELHSAAVYLTMREDFKDAGEINLDDASVIEALNFYVAIGILTESRKNEILGPA